MKNRKESLSRRRMLALSGATGAAALAGCFSGDDGNGNGDDDDGVTPPGQDIEEIDNDVPDNYEEEFDEVVPSGAVNPYDGRFLFNPLGHQFNPGDAQELAYEYLAVYSTAEERFVPRIAEEWDIDDDLTTTVTISDEYGWSDGTPITAADFVTVLKLDSYMEMGIHEYVAPEDVYTVDEYTFEISPRDEYNDLADELWLNQWIETLLHMSEEQYGGFVERFEDADGDDEIEAVQSDVVEYAPHWNEARYSGLFAFTEANEQFADQTPNQHHPVAQDWDIYLRHGEYEDEEGLRAEEVTWEHNQPALEDLPDIYDEPPVSFSGQSLTIIFGPNDEYIRDYPEVRQAIAHAVDFQSIVDVTERPVTPVDPYSCGIDSGYAEAFVHEDVLDAMNSYVERDTDRAQELLEDVGFELDDEQWYTPDGDEWTIDFPVGDWFTDHSEMISNDLAEFGVDMDHFVQEMPTWQGEVEPENDFDLSVHLDYGLARNYHAHADLQTEFMDNRHRAAVTQRELFDEVVEVPEVGNPDGDTITVDIPQRLEDLATAQSEEDEMDAASELAWVHNQLLPGAMVYPWNEHYWVDAGNWDFDLESDDWLTSSRIAHYLLENGLSPE